MEQLILHGIGDFFVQTDNWALNKKKAGRYGLWCCFIHCLTYSLPFLFIGNWKAVSIIFITHFIIDRTRIIDYALAVKNNVRKEFTTWSGLKKPPSKQYDISNFGFSLSRPQFISIWLYIITDNLCHVICNYLALKYL
jgi:hypothetical protein